MNAAAHPMPRSGSSGPRTQCLRAQPQGPCPVRQARLPGHPRLPRPRPARCRLTVSGPSTSTPTSARRSPTTRPAAGRHLGERRLRLPCRHPGDHASGLRRSGRGAGSRSAPRSPTATGRTSAASPTTCPTTCCATRSPSRSALLSAIAESEGTRVSYVKPHGALYHRVTDDRGAGGAVLAGSGDLAALGFPGSRLLALAAAAGRATYDGGVPGPRLRATAG